MVNRELTHKVLFSLTILGCTANVAWPQASTGSVSGTVRDQTGAAVAAAPVELTNTATQIVSRTTTNEVGFYLFPGVMPGVYRLAVKATGMESFEGRLTVQVQQSAVIDVALKVGTVTTMLEVLDVTPVLTLDRPTLGQVLERTRIEQLPIDGRNLTNLLVTVPGAEGLRAYGIRTGAHELLLDGAPLGDRNAAGVVHRQPGLDTIQEFKVETNSSSVKFTRPTSIVAVTKSGTNELHGAVFYTHRNNGIGTARRRQDYYEKAPPLIRNEFGASAGGPVILPRLYDGRDRTFWFFAYEGLRNINPATMGARVPTEAMRRGDFRGLVDAQGRQFKIYDPWTTNPATWQRQQFSYKGQLNVIDPALISPLARYLFEITPLPTIPEANPLVANNWWGAALNTTKNWTVTTRIDHSFSENDRFYARYSQAGFDRLQQRTDYNLPVLDQIAGVVRTLAPNKSIALSWTRVFSPTLFNEMLASGSRQVDWAGSGEPGRHYADELGLPNPFGAVGFPKLDATQALPGYRFWSHNTRGVPYVYALFQDDVTKIRGKHELQFGFYHRYDQLNFLPDQQQSQGRHNWNTLATSIYDPNTSRTNPLAVPLTGHALANMYLGVTNYLNQFERGYFYVRSREYALYLQDNFKVTPRFTLNLGLRWDYWPAFREKNGLMTSFDTDRRAIVLGQDLNTMYRLGATLPSIVERLENLGAKFVTYDQVGLPRNLMQSEKTNFGPRLGFAYRAGDGARSFVMRGGYRISYFRIPARNWVARMALNNSPMRAAFESNLTSATLSPDGIANYGMRSTPTVVAGVNSRDAVPVGNATSLSRGSVNAMHFARSMPDPRVHDWNFTLEKELMAGTLVRASYVGNHGSSLDMRYEYNQPTPEYIWFMTTGQRLPTGEYAAVARRPYDQTVYGMIEEYRMSGWSNFQGVELLMERRYSKGLGFQVFYNVANALAATNLTAEDGPQGIPELNQFLPGAVPADVHERIRFLNYGRDTSLPKHRMRWNWIADLPFGRGKPIGAQVGGFLNRVIGGWQIAGMGTLRSNYFSLPTNIYATGSPIEVYGKKYPIQDCRGGICRPGYLWWNGYIPANQINSYDAQGRPNGVIGVPDSYRPAGEPLIPWPAKSIPGDPLAPWYGTNTVWVPLKDGSVQQTTFNDNLHPWRKQYLPDVWQWNLDASLFKTIPINDRVNMRFNADFFNVLNMPGTPPGVGGDGLKLTHTSGQAARVLQLTLRLSW